MQSNFSCGRYKKGWFCTRNINHQGPCALKPKWWNLFWLYKMIAVFVLCLFFSSVIAQTQHLSGTFKNPDGTNINGSFTIGLQGAVFKNICTTPYQVVPTETKNYIVSNGELVGASTDNFVSQDCLYPRKPYYVTMLDNLKDQLFTDNWYLPRVVSNNIDVGSMSAELMGNTPISVSLPIGIISTPSNSQVITQPSGTSLTINGALILNGAVTFATSPNFAQVITGQVLVGGITSSPFKLDVNGVIDAQGGYAVGGSGGSAGQCIVSNGTSGVWGTCTQQSLPTLYNQQLTLNAVALPQRRILDIDGPFFATDDSANNISHITMSTTGPSAFVVTTGATLSGTNCIQGDGNGGITTASIACGNGDGQRMSNAQGYYRLYGDGSKEEWGTTTGCAGGACSVFVPFPYPILNPASAIITANCVNEGNCSVTFNGSTTTTGFSLTFAPFVYVGGSGQNNSGGQHANWHVNVD